MILVDRVPAKIASTVLKWYLLTTPRCAACSARRYPLPTEHRCMRFEATQALFITTALIKKSVFAGNCPVLLRGLPRDSHTAGALDLAQCQA